MQHTWTAYLQYNGNGNSIFESVEFPISVDLFKEIQSCITNCTLIRTTDFYEDLQCKAEEAFNFEGWLREIYHIEKPNKDDYDSESEYQDAVDEDQNEIEQLKDQYYLVNNDILDPTEEKQFKDQFIGTAYNFDDEEFIEIEDMHEDGEFRHVIYSLIVNFDDNGVITDITDIDAQGLESESIRYTKTNDAYPDYDILSDLLKEELSKYVKCEEAEDIHSEEPVLLYPQSSQPVSEPPKTKDFSGTIDAWISGQVELFVPDLLLVVDKIAKAGNDEQIYQILRFLRTKENNKMNWTTFIYHALMPIYRHYDVQSRQVFSDEIDHIREVAYEYKKEIGTLNPWRNYFQYQNNNPLSMLIDLLN